MSECAARAVARELCWQRDARRSVGYLLTGFLISALSARAEAPPTQEFWNYLVEFGDAQGEVFDPSDFAAVANLPEKARSEFNRAQEHSSSELAPASLKNAKDGQEQQ